MIDGTILYILNILEILNKYISYMFDKNIGMYFDSFLTISVPLIILVF